MNIGLDLDGVLHPWHEGVWRRLTNEGYIDTSFDVYWDQGWLEMREEQPILFMNMVNDPLMYSSQAPYFGVRSFLKSLKNDGHTIWYITQRPEHLEFTTECWVRHWRLPFEENLIRVDTSKKRIIIEKEIDLFVDDSERHVVAVKDFTNVILIEKPWNKEVQKDYNSVASVLQIGKYINGKE